MRRPASRRLMFYVYVYYTVSLMPSSIRVKLHKDWESPTKSVEQCKQGTVFLQPIQLIV